MKFSGITSALSIILACLALQACGHNITTKKVIVLGIDGMDPGFLERHWDSLPNLKGLRDTGSFERLRTTIPPQSPVAWASFITGLDPGGTGIFDFVHRDPATMQPFSSMAGIEPSLHTLAIGPYLLPLSQGRVVRYLHGEAFWQFLDRAGVPATILRIPDNFPPIESRSKTLSGMGTPDMSGTFGTFTFFTNDPLATAEDVSGGRIVPVRLDQTNRTELTIQGPPNNLRKDHAVSTLRMVVHRDATNAVALFEVEDQKILLKQGEWSPWMRVAFPIIPGLKNAAGMFRVFAKELQPGFAVYVSPVNIDPFTPELPISAPAGYSRELATAIGPFYTQGIPEDTAALRQGIFTRDEFLFQTGTVAEEQFRMLEYALRNFAGGVVFLHFSVVDQNSHVLWGAYEKELLKTYQRVDTEVGRVRHTQPNATLIVMSDHGFAAFNRAVNLNTWLYEQGFLALRSPANLGPDPLFAHVDWSQTKAYAIGLNAVYINLAGRERNGIVSPADRERVVDAIADRLKELRDPQGDVPVVSSVYRSRDVYHGSQLAAAPDIIVGWARGYRASWQTALGAIPPNVVQDNQDEWRADHCIDPKLVPGVLLTNRKVIETHPWLGDITVTLLDQFGIAPGPGMRGRPLF
ncbi:MAG TPA: alkaline phosphatase family protein [Bryobacteraceae bacterium]|nr:alkaline phosphatase family protein [Bryobacteraceae bacterium]